MDQNNTTKKKEKKILIYIAIAAIILIILCVFLFIIKKGKYVGTWDCKGYSESKVLSENYRITIKLNNFKSFTYGEYDNLDKTYTSGDYSEKEHKDNDYVLELKSNKFVIDGKEEKNYPTNKLKVNIVNDKEMIINFDNATAKYYCYKK